MQAEQIQQVLENLKLIVFLLQTCIVGISFLCGFCSMQFIVHAKNQKHLF